MQSKGFKRYGTLNFRASLMLEGVADCIYIAMYIHVWDPVAAQTMVTQATHLCLQLMLHIHVNMGSCPAKAKPAYTAVLHCIIQNEM